MRVDRIHRHMQRTGIDAAHPDWAISVHLSLEWSLKASVSAHEAIPAMNTAHVGGLGWALEADT